MLKHAITENISLYLERLQFDDDQKKQHERKDEHEYSYTTEIEDLKTSGC